MKVSEALNTRRAIKNYDTEFKMSDADFATVMDAVLKSPSSFNIQNWRFVDVQDTNLRQQIREAAWDQAQVTEASKLILLCADVKAWEKDTAQYWAGAPKEIAEMMTSMTKDFYEGREWIQRDEALRSVGIAAQSFMLTATEMGFDTCPMIGFDQDAVGKLINLPEDHIIGMMLVIGKRREAPFPSAGRLNSDAVIIKDKFKKNK